MARRKPCNPFRILVDRREQRPYTFFDIRGHEALPFVVELATLPTGDYVAGEGKDPARQAVVERKSLQDLYGTLSQGRERFLDEWRRMESFGYAAVVIEADWLSILTPNDHLRRETLLNPRSVVGTLVAWSQRHGVHVFPVPDRDFAEIFTFRLLERWIRDQRIADDCIITAAKIATASTE